MAGQLSVYQANLVLNKLLRGEDFTVPPSYWIGLFKSSNGDALRANAVAAADEVTAVGYSRIKLRGDASVTFTQSTAAWSQISATLLWPDAEAPWGLVTYAAIMDAETGGNVVLLGQLTTPKTVDVGDGFRIPLNLFTVSL